jgi:hypothetical protein
MCLFCVSNRDENNRNVERAREWEKRTHELEAKIEPLLKQVREIESEKSALLSDKLSLETENKRWAERNKKLLDRYQQIDPEIHKQLKDNFDQLSHEKQTLEQELNEAKIKITKIESELVINIEKTNKLKGFFTLFLFNISCHFASLCYSVVCAFIPFHSPYNCLLSVFTVGALYHMHVICIYLMNIHVMYAKKDAGFHWKNKYDDRARIINEYEKKIQENDAKIKEAGKQTEGKIAAETRITKIVNLLRESEKIIKLKTELYEKGNYSISPSHSLMPLYSTRFFMSHECM